MTRNQEIGFICIFLLIIFSVPGVQTGYEYFVAKDTEGRPHHIQMLDLLEDLFITPMKLANRNYDNIQKVKKQVDSLALELTTRAGSLDSTQSWNTERAEDLLSRSEIEVKLLKTGVIDYNRHVKARADTARPYFRSLRALHRQLRTIDTLVRDGEAPSSILPAAASAQSEISAAEKHFGPKKGPLDFPMLTLVALRRIMVGAEYLRPYEKEMEKSSVFANTIRPWFLFAYYTLFGDLGEKGVLGKNGWFFYRPGVDYLTKYYIFDKHSQIVDPNDVPIRDAIIDTIAAFRDELKARGTDLLVVIMPGKPSIYPDMLNPKMKPESAGTFTHSLRIMEEMKKAGIETVDLFKVFAEERKNDVAAGDSIYLHTDTHFRGRGVLACAKAVADRVRQYPWFAQGNVEYAVDTVFEMRDGDIGTMTDLPAMAIRDLKFSFPLEKTRCYQVWRIDRDENGNETGRTPYRDNYATSKILLLGDSFSRIYQTDPPKSAGWISHLSRELGQPIASIVNDGGASTLVREMLVEKLSTLNGKKLVVWEIVERDFRFGEKGWKHVKLEKPED